MTPSLALPLRGRGRGVFSVAPEYEDRKGAGMRLGFVGTGTIAAAMVEGLGGGAVLSPRGAVVAADLSRRFPGVTVADSNQAVLDQSDMVVLAMWPAGGRGRHPRAAVPAGAEGAEPGRRDADRDDPGLDRAGPDHRPGDPAALCGRTPLRHADLPAGCRGCGAVRPAGSDGGVPHGRGVRPAGCRGRR